MPFFFFLRELAMLTLLRQAQKVVAYNVRKFWERGANLGYVFLVSWFVLALWFIPLTIFSASTGNITFEKTVIAAFFVSMLLVADVNATVLCVRCQRRKNLFEGVGPDTDVPLRLQRFPSCFPFRELFSVTDLVYLEHFCYRVDICRSSVAKTIAWWQRLNHEADDNA